MRVALRADDLGPTWSVGVRSPTFGFPSAETFRRRTPKCRYVLLIPRLNTTIGVCVCVRVWKEMNVKGQTGKIGRVEKITRPPRSGQTTGYCGHVPDISIAAGASATTDRCYLWSAITALVYYYYYYYTRRTAAADDWD